MLKNYLTTIFRSVTRQKVFSLINIMGLATAMACCTMLGLYVRYELGFESTHENRDSLYRVLAEVEVPWSDAELLNQTPAILAKAMKSDLPEVVNATHVGDRPVEIGHEDKFIDEDRFFFADPEFLEMFTFPLVQGDAASSLSEPYSVLVTESTAARLFGDEDPIGKVIELRGNVVRFTGGLELTVTGVLRDSPRNSHIQIDYLASQSTVRDYYGGSSGHQGCVMVGVSGDIDWRMLQGPTYFQLQPGVDPDLFAERFSAWTASHYPEGDTIPFIIQPISDIRLHGHAMSELETNTDLGYVYFIAAMAGLILLIASFNYVNLATARAVDRSREAAVRKILGASRWQVFQRFMCESLMMAGVAMVLALVFVEIWLPTFSQLVGVELSFSFTSDLTIVTALVGAGVIVGLLAGAYPAIFLSAAVPVDVVKSGTLVGKRGAPYLRNGLVTIQYLVSIALVICTLVIYQQLSYIGTRDMGYTTDNVVAFDIREVKLQKSYPSLEGALKAIPGVTAITGSQALPVEQPGGASKPWWEGKEAGSESFFLHRSMIHEDFLDFYEIPLIAGRKFSAERPSDKKNTYIMNEAAVRACGWDEAIGKRFGWHEGAIGVVIGVVKDFHFQPLQKQIEPLVFALRTGQPRMVSVKVEAGQMTRVVDEINVVWREYSERPLQFKFVSEKVAAAYGQEQRLQRVFGYSAILALAIAGLGLGGLAAYTTEQRRKEIGVRKVLGSSSASIATLLIRQFVRWVAVANLVACPLAYYAMKDWLDNFAYRIGLGWEPFVWTAVVTLVVAAATVCYQAVKAARANPVEALKYE